MAVVTPTPIMQFIDAAGVPLAGGLLYTYAAGTTTPQDTYTDSTGATPNTNPVVLNARGEANVWLGAATYKFKLCDANNTEVWTVDYISAPTTALSPVLSGNVTIDSDSAGPALKITQTGTGPVLRVQDSIDPDSTPFIIDATGQVGIGTASPATALDVSDGTIQISSAGGTSYTTLSADATNSNIEAVGARNLVLKTNTTPRVTVSSTLITVTNPIVLPADPTTSLQASTKQYVDSASVVSSPSGIISPYAGNSAPSGWLLCDGSAVSRSTYANLFTAISTLWGIGDGSTTFNVPDLRGQFLRGYDSRIPSLSKDTTIFSGVLTSGNSTVSGINSTTYLYAGMPITGTGISAGTTISSVSTNSIVLSANATASSSTLSAATTNTSTTVLVSSTSTLSVGQAVSGTNIPTGAYITAITGPTTITISSAATGSTATVNFTTTLSTTTVSAGTNATLAAGMAISGAGIPIGATISSLTGGTGGTAFVMSLVATTTNAATPLLFTTGTITVGNTLTVGRTFASAQADAFANHGHGLSDPGHQHNVFDSGSNGGGGGGLVGFGAIRSTANAMAIAGTGATVNNSYLGNVETRPKNYAVLYIIKT